MNNNIQNRNGEQNYRNSNGQIKMNNDQNNRNMAINKTTRIVINNE